MSYIFVALVAVAVAIFAMQNTMAVTIRFLMWQIEATPLAAVILLSLGLGMVLVGIPLLVSRWRLRSRVRSLESRLDAQVDSSLPSRRLSGPE